MLRSLLPRQNNVCASALILLAVASGCGSEAYYPVSGVVKLDDQPLADADISFISVDEDNPSAAFARTDASGNYTLQFTGDVQGLPVGSYEVRISTYRDAKEGIDEIPAEAGAPELVPAKYNVETELVREVTDQENRFDFALESR